MHQVNRLVASALLQTPAHPSHLATQASGICHNVQMRCSACRHISERRATTRAGVGDTAFLHEEDGSVTVRDDLDALLQVLPADIRKPLVQHSNRAYLLEVVLDLGRRPEARFLGSRSGEYLRDTEIRHADLQAAEQAVGDFGGDNRAGVPVTGHIDMIRDILGVPNSMLFIGRPGVGKTTVIRELARVLADDFHKRVVIVDTSNELGGDGDIPHPAIGGARRMQVPDPSEQHKIMIEAVENHMPEIVIVDEVGTEAEALACRTIAERGVQLIGTAHGQLLENLLKNPTLSDLVGGIQSVTLGDDEAHARGTQKSVLERKAPATFPVVIEMRERALWVTHWTEDSVDCILHGKDPIVQVRRRDLASKKVLVEEQRYGNVDQAQEAEMAGLPGGDGEASVLSSSSPQPSSSFGTSFSSNDDDPYGWVQRLQSVPDKDALQELAQLGYSANDRSYNGMQHGRKLRRRGSRS